MDAARRLAVEAAAESELAVCPTCSAPLSEGDGYGSGRLEDEIFCLLRCYAQFHGPAILRRRPGPFPEV